MYDYYISHRTEKQQKHKSNVSSPTIFFLSESVAYGRLYGGMDGLIPDTYLFW